TLGGVDEDAELAAADAFLLEDRIVFVGDGPLGGHLLASLVVSDAGEALLKSRRLYHFAQDRGIGTLGDAVHAAHAVVGEELGDVGSDVAEVAEGSGSRGND